MDERETGEEDRETGEEDRETAEDDRETLEHDREIAEAIPDGGKLDDQALLDRAREAVSDAYAPYSDYAVGAALETADGTVYTGCNIEVANYSNSLHAEEVALGRAVRDGHRSFERVAVSSAARDGVTPCGMCRQSFAEFCPADFTVVCESGGGDDRDDKVGEDSQEGEVGEDDEGPVVYDLGTLLPETITREMVER